VFAPRFDEAQLVELARSFTDDDSPELTAEVVPRVRAAGYLTKLDVEAFRRWKWPPSRGRPSTDSEEFIRATSGAALSTSNERLRIEALTLLNGVGWPVASVILHFVHDSRYPILDRRALAALGDPDPTYCFDLWWAYTLTCRDLADRHNLSMRPLDRALWQLAGP